MVMCVKYFVGNLHICMVTVALETLLAHKMPQNGSKGKLGKGLQGLASVIDTIGTTDCLLG